MRLRDRLAVPATLGLHHPPRWSILGAFLAADAALIAIHIVNVVTVKNRFLMINLEFSAAESFQYVKFLTIAFVMVVFTRRTRQFGPAFWSLIFLYLAADDAFALHEALGRALARWWGLEEGAVISQTGAGLGVGLAIGIVATVAYLIGGLGGRVSAMLALGFLGLGFFGVGVDAFHGLDFVLEDRWLNIAVRIIEEGGEMLFASFLVAFTLMVLRDARPQGPLEPAVATDLT